MSRHALTPRTDALTPRTDALTPRTDAITPPRHALTPRTDALTPRGIALTVALVRACGVYAVTLAPHVKGQMRACRSQALALADPRARRLALEKLESERFNAEAAAMAATIAPRHSRRLASTAIVALEVMFD